MGQIGIERIGTNAYAPASANAINLYSIDGAEGLTLGQLIAAVSLRTAAIHERRGVLLMNGVTSQNSFMTAMANVAQQIITDGSSYAALCKLPDNYTPRSSVFSGAKTIYNFLVYECELQPSDLPANLNGENQRLKAFAQLKSKIDSATTTSQETMIELQTCISRRDVAIQTSTNLVKALGLSSENTASNI